MKLKQSTTYQLILLTITQLFLLKKLEVIKNNTLTNLETQEIKTDSNSKNEDENENKNKKGKS